MPTDSIPQAASVRNLQTMLRVIATNQQSGLSVIPDGIYGPQTERAVRAFQRTNALPVTGITDLVTWEKIVQAYDAALLQQMQASPLRIILQPNQVIAAGEKNGHLYLIQALMAALADHYNNMPSVHITGVHDVQSQDAVRFLRKMGDLGDSCNIDKPFYALLAALYRIAIGDGTP